MALPFGLIHRASDLSREECDLVRKLLESQGYRELAAAHAFGAGLPLAPTLDDKLLLADEILEELGHFEAAAALHAELECGDLLLAIDGRIRVVPIPSSWLEVAIVRFLFDRAEKFQLREYRSSRFTPLARMVERILPDEESHGAAGEALLRELCCAERGNTALAQACFLKWLRISLMSFGRPGSARGLRAVALGLKARDSADVMREFLCDLLPTMSACGLRFPPERAIELDLPDGIFPE
ncbi:MAG: phenylacetate-CoA oxygenase subunit PaaI [Deltaproteobacteria bacterium]|nr:phenylacetate-CoA oxygenase subunit PaaI [Deltaproteobacteria bacterium]